MKDMTWEEFSGEYCKTQGQTPEGLAETLRDKVKVFQPDGFMLLRAALMDSSWCGQHTILPYGPRNTYKTVPDHPVSPRGLASDTSVVIGVLKINAVPT